MEHKQKTTHTPGPWKVVKEFDHLVEQNMVRIKSGHEDICEMTGTAAGANARLIALAPELYELALWVKESFRPDERPEYVDALIAKAKGE